MLDNNKVFVHVPEGTSVSSNKRIGKTVGGMIQFATKENSDAQKNCATEVLRVINNLDADSFLTVAQREGYCTQLTPKISAEFWGAMAEEANLKARQQRTINAYLSYHFGKRICVSGMYIIFCLYIVDIK